jgi:iron complex outermembrane recepter protein
MALRAAKVAAGGLMASAMLLWVWATNVLAAPSSRELDVAPQDLATALRQLAVSQHVELLFDAAQMGGRRSAAVHAAADIDSALRQMLAGTGFVARHEAGMSPGRRP